MKNLVLLFSLLISYSGSSQTSVFQCGVIDPIVSQSDIDNASYEFHKQCIDFEEQQSYLFNGNQNKKVTAGEYIQINKDFHAGPFTQQGGLWMNIDSKSAFDVAVMNYPDLNNVLRYEKLELGVELPDDIQEKINNFINQIDAPQINPYLDWEIRVYAEFNCISPAYNVAPFPSIEIDGYFTQEFQSWSAPSLPTPTQIGPNCFSYTSESQYDQIGGYNEIPTNHSYRIRFAPPVVGYWIGNVKIELPGGQVISSNDFGFNVIPSMNEGYLKVGNSGRFLKLGQESFYPVGCNLPWPETNNVFDPELDMNMHSWTYWLTDPFCAETDCSYTGWMVAPRVYQKYRDVMGNLANAGANSIRTIMYPTATDIEWENLGDYTNRLHMAQELDSILMVAENRGIYLLWDFQIHYSFQFSENAYNKNWTWDVGPYGDSICYRKLLALNGQSDDNPIIFLQDSLCKKYYKQKLRYIISRWGYSTNIGIMEMFSELSNVGSDQADVSNFYRTGDNYKIFRDWVLEMAHYIKSFHNGKNHLVTSSYAGEIAEDDNVYWHEAFNLMSSNIYNFGNPAYGDFWIDNIANRHLSENTDEPHSYVVSTEHPITGATFNGNNSYFRNIKPLLYSEIDPIQVCVVCPNNHVEINRHLWQSIFSGLAGSYSWTLMNRPLNYDILGRMKSFISVIDYENDQWHPGSTKLKYKTYEPNAWEFQDNYADRMIGKNKKADLSYLRSGDKNYAIGIVTNRTYNVFSSATCADSVRLAEGWSETNLTYATVKTGNGSGGERLKLKGMKAGLYKIEYYYPDAPDDIIDVSFDVGPNVEIDFEPDLGTTDGTFMVLFRARRNNQVWIPESEMDSISDDRILSNEELIDSIKTDVFPVPSEEELNIFVDTDGLEAIITSVDGRFIERIKLTSRSQTIDVREYIHGTYIILFFKNHTLYDTKKFVKL